MGKLSSLRPIGLAPARTSSSITTSLLLSTSSRPTTPSTTTTTTSCLFQVRRATFIPRPRRPYTFTQLIQLSDGSTYTARTTSPLPLYRAAKDTRNTLLWQPSEKSLRNVELDEAGKLAAFRERFGRGFDAVVAEEVTAEQAQAQAVDEGGLDFEDLIAEFAPQDTGALKDSGPKKAAVRRK